MDFKEYRYVLKVAELRNMTRAAGELYISQPSLSHYIAKIEEELGAQLFNRGTTPISLTLAGEKYVETAKMVMSLNDRLKQEVSDISTDKRGVITVGMSHARASFFLPYVLPEFKRCYPGIDIRTVEVRSDLVEEYVAKGQCDLGIVPFPLSGKYELDQEAICREELLLVSGKPLLEEQFAAGKPYVELGELGGYDFTLLKKGHGIRTAVDVLFMEHGIKPSHVFETTSNETAYRLATVDLGLSIVPETTVILSHGVRTPYIYSISRDGVYWDAGAVYRRQEFLSTAQRTFLKLVQKRFAGGVMAAVEEERAADRQAGQQADQNT